MAKYNLRKGSIQWGFHTSRAKVQMFGGGFANGKSAALCIKVIRVASQYPGANILVARSTYPRLNDSIRKEFFKWLPEDWIARRPTDKDNTLILTNGTVVNFRYVAQKGKTSEDGQTTSNLLSNTYDLIAVDQVEDPEITFKDFHDLMGRLRGTTPYRPPPGEEDATMPATGPRWLLLTCNPTRNWVYKQLILPYQFWRDKGIYTDNLMVDPNTREPIMELYEGSTYTNKENLPGDFIEGLESTYQGQMRARFLMGEWAAFEGLVYPMFNEARHMVPRAKILEHIEKQRIRHYVVKAREAYDFGIVSPSCYLLAAVDGAGRVLVFDGYYRPEYELGEQADGIKTVRHNYWGDVEFSDPINADPDVFRRKVIAGHHSTGESVANIFAAHGIAMKPASNDKLSGIAKVTTYLSGVKGIENPFNPADENPPLMYIAEELDWFGNEILNYMWKRNPQGQFIDEPMDKDDHAMDTAKYLVADLPDPAELVIPKHAQVPQYMYWHEYETDKRGRIIH